MLAGQAGKKKEEEPCPLDPSFWQSSLAYSSYTQGYTTASKDTSFTHTF
jgi:hypothetical protein